MSTIWVHRDLGSEIQWSTRPVVVYENYLKAGNPETPAAELRELAADQDHRVRRRLAENASTPLDIVELLACDANAEVRIAVAENAGLPRQILESLVDDDDVYVRFALAGQYSLPLDLLEKLANDDDNPYVRDHADRTLQGLFLEKALQEARFVAVSGETEKLGDLLVEAGVLTRANVDELLRLAREREIPLGRAIVQSRALSRRVVVAALKAQTLLREGKGNHEKALLEIQRSS